MTSTKKGVAPQTGVLLINLGSPISPAVADVRRYLREFLSDGRVIDLPGWARWMLVNLVIAPFRSPKSAKEYRKIWNEEGFPLIVHSQHLATKLQASLGRAYEVHLAMRYQQPSLTAALQACERKNYRRLIIVPLFPQYASATTGSINQKVMSLISQWSYIPELLFIDSFCNQSEVAQAYAKVWEDSAANKLATHWDHTLFSYHGLPEKHLLKESRDCLTTHCCDNYTGSNRLCYRAQCYQTSRQLADCLGLDASQYTTSFQSRLGRLPWIQPYTSDIITELAQRGVKRLRVFCPAFTADCLETLVEIGEQYQQLFLQQGGEELVLVESLNDHPAWVAVLTRLITAKSADPQ